MKTLSTPCVEISFNKSTIFLLSSLIFTISLVNVSIAFSIFVSRSKNFFLIVS